MKSAGATVSKKWSVHSKTARCASTTTTLTKSITLRAHPVALLKSSTNGGPPTKWPKTQRKVCRWIRFYRLLRQDHNTAAVRIHHNTCKRDRRSRRAFSRTTFTSLSTRCWHRRRHSRSCGDAQRRARRHSWHSRKDKGQFRPCHFRRHIILTQAITSSTRIRCGVPHPPQAVRRWRCSRWNCRGYAES